VRVARKILIVALCAALSTPVSALSCKGVFSWVGGAALGILKHTAKTLVYLPVVLPVKLAAGTVGHVRAGKYGELRLMIPRTLWRDKWHLSGYALLLMLQQTTGITHNQFENETEGFEPYGGDGVRVIVDGFDEKDPLYGDAAKTIYEKRYKDKDTGQKVVFIRVRKWSEVQSQLRAIAREHGKISHVDYLGHGFPGMLDLPEGAILPHVETGRWKYYDPLAEQQSKGFGDVFLPGAKVRFTSCFTMNNNGKNDMFQMGVFMLGQEGGSVYGSKTQILPNWIEMGALKLGLNEPPKWLKHYGDFLSVGNGLMTGFTQVQVTQPKNYAGYFHRNRTETVAIPKLSPSDLSFQNMTRIGKIASDIDEPMTRAAILKWDLYNVDRAVGYDPVNLAMKEAAEKTELKASILSSNDRRSFGITLDSGLDRDTVLDRLKQAFPNYQIEGLRGQANGIQVRLPPAPKLKEHVDKLLAERAKLEAGLLKHEAELKAAEQGGLVPEHVLIKYKQDLVDLRKRYENQGRALEADSWGDLFKPGKR
jgi:hypothetical protein